MTGQVETRTGVETGLLQPPAQPAAFPWFEALFAAAICIFFAWYAKHFLSSTFRFWDDEGYVLLSLKHYLEGAPLYTDTFTQYGPFYFLTQGFWFGLLNLPVTHDTGRIFTLICWVASALLGAAAICSLRRNLLLAAGAFAALTVQASALANEPGHPQQLILLLLAGSVFASAWLLPRRPVFGLLLLGAIGSAMVFTKVNVGLFYMIPLVHTLFCLLPRTRFRTIAVAAVLIVSFALPCALMRTNPFGVGGYCLAATFSIMVTFSCGALVNPGSPLGLRDMLLVVLGALVSGGAIVLGTLAHGVSIAGFVEGVFLSPARFPTLFLLPLKVRPAEVLGVLLGSCFVGEVTRLVKKGRSHRDAEWLGILRAVAGFCAIPLLLAGHLVWALPIVPLILIPPAGACRHWTEWLPRVFLADLAVMQFLQAYPIAGSQVQMASVPTLLCALVCLSDGSAALHRVLARFKPISQHMVVTAIAALVCATVLAQVWTAPLTPAGFGNPHSQLRGASSLTIEPRVEAGYRYIAGRVRANCDVLFTLPGMGSFNFWSGVETPNAANFTAWVSLFTTAQQERILQVMRARPAACVVYNQELLQLWRPSRKHLAASPLARYITRDMVKAAERDGYEIRVHPGRTVPWIE